MNNSNNKLIKKDNNPNWSQLFEINYIGRYINKSELIELSKSCKYYRYRLNPIIFKKLKLLKEGIILPFNKNSKATYKHKLEILIKRLKFDLRGVSQLVIVIELCDGFSKEFPIGLVNLFPNITIFKVYSKDYRYDLISLTDTLSKLNNLRGVELSAGYYNYPPNQSELIINFFKCLNSLKFLRNNHSIPNNSPFLQINSSYSKLNTVTIYDDRVLSNLQSHLPNLKQIELPNYRVNEHLLINFLKLNPQLTKIYCRWIRIEMIQRIWSIPLNITRSLVEYKDRDYYNLFLTILNLYNIKYILLEYILNSNLIIKIVKVNLNGLKLEFNGEYTSSYSEANWKILKKLDNVLIMKYSYYKFYEFSSPINYTYGLINYKLIIN